VAGEASLDAGRLAAMVGELLAEPKTIRIKAMAMRALGRPDATEKIVDVCVGLTGR
jgi:UDP-N-acetylglucosamine:LPS N-acetylglucosamine transferase